jgi:hypothetical protein
MCIHKYVLVDKHSIAPALHQGPLEASDLLYVSIARRRNSQSPPYLNSFHRVYYPSSPQISLLLNNCHGSYHPFHIHIVYLS